MSETMSDTGYLDGQVPDPGQAAPDEPASLHSRLKEHCDRVHAWPGFMAQELGSLRTPELFRLVRKLGLRHRLYGTDPARRVEVLPPWHAAAVAAPRHEMSTWTRAQLLHFLSRMPKRVSQRLQHVWQVNVQPEFLVRKAFTRHALTFMATPETCRFREGERFIPLDLARAAHMSVRMHWFGPDQAGPMWDLKLLRFELDADTHRVFLGGNALNSTGEMRSRCERAYLFNYAPHRGNSDVLLDSHAEEVIASGLDLHWALEQSVLDPSGRKPEGFDLPSVWLGFEDPGDVDIEPEAPGLQQVAFNEVLFWFQARKPAKWPRLPCLGSVEVGEPIMVKGWKRKPTPASGFGSKLRHPGNCWTDIAEQLGEADATHLLLEVMDKSQAETRDGLSLWPLAYFAPGSPQKPARKAVRAFLDFEGLMGRALCDPRLKQATEPRLAKCQVAWLQDRSRLVGYSNDISFDFESVPPWVSHKFQAVRD